MERAFTPRLVTDPPRSRLAAQLSKLAEAGRPATMPARAAASGNIGQDYCGVQVPAKRQKHF